jgi:hypothetical protein
LRGISEAIPCSDQPISQATLLGESKYLTSWVTPDSLEIQAKYSEITHGLTALKDKIYACWDYVNGIPYTQFINAHLSVDGKSYVRRDVWLEPGQTVHAPALNCANRAFLLSSLLRQELRPQEIYICFGNLNFDHQDGHAWVYAILDREYIMETTSPTIRTPFIEATEAEIYESVIFFNDQEVRYIPNAGLREPLSYCYCVKWLEEYVDNRACDAYI